MCGVARGAVIRIIGLFTPSKRMTATQTTPHILKAMPKRKLCPQGYLSVVLTMNWHQNEIAVTMDKTFTPQKFQLNNNNTRACFFGT